MLSLPLAAPLVVPLASSVTLVSTLLGSSTIDPIASILKEALPVSISQHIPGFQDAVSPEETASLLESTEWTLKHFPGTSITFKEGRFFGNDGCNSLSGSAVLSGDTITFDGLAVSTLMACLPGKEAGSHAFRDLIAEGTVIASPASENSVRITKGSTNQQWTLVPA